MFSTKVYKKLIRFIYRSIELFDWTFFAKGGPEALSLQYQVKKQM